jgi:hypothetical protein
MRRTVPLVTLLAFASAFLPAQSDPVPTDAAKTGTAKTVTAPAPVYELTVVGPAGWRTRFAPTNVGSLLESETGHAMWQPVVAQLDALVQGAFGDAAAYAAARQRLLDYAGEVHLLMWFNKRGETDPPEPPEGGLVFGPDGKTDLDKLAVELKLAMQLIPDLRLEKATIGGAEREVFKGPDVTVGVPARDGDRVVLACSSTDLARAEQRVRALAPPKPPRPDAPALALRFDIAALFAAMPEDRESLAMRVVAFDALRTVELQLHTAGPRIALDLGATFSGPDRGFLGCLFPVAPGMSSMVGLLPKGQKAWKVGHLDLQQGYLAIERMTALMDENPKDEKGRREAIDKARKKVTEEMGLDPVADLFPHLATDAMMLGSIEEAADDKAGFLLALRVRNDDAFRKALDTIARKGKGFLNKMSSTDHDGVAIDRYGGMISGEMHLAVGRGLCVLATGPDAEERIGKLLDQQKAAMAAPADGKPPALTALPGFEMLERFAPAGCNGAASGELVPVLRVVAKTLEGIGRIAPIGFPDAIADFDDEAAAKLGTTLAAHHLDLVQTMTGSTADRWQLRILW